MVGMDSDGLESSPLAPVGDTGTGEAIDAFLGLEIVSASGP